MTSFDYWVFGIFGAIVLIAIFFPKPPDDEYDRECSRAADTGWGA